ncbi:MAG: hypothetical protein KC478_02480, partial [Bacteriovoracaceae bacterium]|nr:hypothetical protein [Bacteriovoracaceae bacterium]
MELSLLNILFFINAVVVGFSRKEIKIPVSSIFAVASLLCYGIYLGFYQTGINTQVWPVLIFSQMYFLQEVLLSRRNKGAAPELALVCGIAPLLLISTNNLL